MRIWNGNTIWMTCLLLGGFAACNKPSFRSEQKQPEPENHLVPIGGIDDVPAAGEKKVRPIDTVDFTIAKVGSRVERSSIAEQYPVDLYFVVDGTGSMDTELEQVKTGITAISQNLKAKGIDLNAGFIGFVDGPESIDDNRVFKLSSDMDALQRFVATIKPTGNSDYPEGSLMAASRAIDRFAAGDGRPNAAKMILLISDVVGHNGGPIGTDTDVTRDCSVAALTAKVNDYAIKLGDQNKLKFFYVVPDIANLTSANPGDRTNADYRCATSPGATTTYNAKEQMEALLQGLIPTVPQARRGGPLLDSTGKLAWPLRDNNLVDVLVPLIVNTRPQEQPMMCFATKFVALEGAQTLFTWEAQSLVAAMQNPQETLLMDDVLRAGQSQAAVRNIQLKVNRCCVATDQSGKIKEPNAPSCAKDLVQTINYRITSP